MYAIVKVGGKQYRVEKGDSLLVDRMPQQEGAKLALEPLLFKGEGSGDTVFAADDLGKVKVEAVVTGHERGPKIHVLKFKPKRGYKRRMGHRSDLTRLEIGDIKLLSRKPAAAKSVDEPTGETVAKPKGETVAKPKGETAAKPKGETAAKPKGETAAKPKKPAAKKPAAKRPAAKADGTKAAAAKKPAAEKAAAKKPAAEKEDGDGA
jgi:large subunit ribosomal protein L21